MLKWLIGAVALAAIGAGAQRLAEARDRRRFPAPGRLVPVGDAELHVVVQGSGPPVLIDSGLGGSSIEWSRVARELESDFTVIRYDRPGFAWSPGSGRDRRALAAAERIIDLLRVLGPDPAILVGHSLGGIHVRVAAALAPERVSGLVLVDPSHEGMLAVVEGSRAAAVTRSVLRFVAWSSPLGIGRLAGRLFARMALADRRQPLEPTELEGVRLSGVLTCRTVRGLRALSAEHAALGDSLRQLVGLSQSHPTPALPLTVITATAPSGKPRIVAARAEMDALHARLVAASPRGRQMFADRSGHLVPLDQPEIIARCVRETATAITAGTWPTELGA